MKPIAVLTLLNLVVTLPVLAYSSADILGQFPRDKYIIGIGEVESSGDNFKDRRRAEILARLEIAKQLRVRVKEESVDIMCEGKASRLFVGSNECRNVLSTIIEVTVDEVLVGSRIVEAGRDSAKGTYYAVAVLSKEDAASAAERRLKEAMEKTKEFIGQARNAMDYDSKRVNTEKAKEEFLRGIAYEGGRLAVEGARLRAKDSFEELADQIKKLFSAVDMQPNPQ